MSAQRRIDRVERQIDDLRVEFERFFSGDLGAPPEPLRSEIRGGLRSLRANQFQTPVDSFRITQLEARFNSYNELFNRRLREREEGRDRQTAAPPPRRPDPVRGVVVGSRIDAEAVKALYRGLHAGGDEVPRFDLDAFRSYLERQLASIRAKTGCSEIQFRTISEGGKVKLKAKPLAGSDEPAAGRRT